MVFMSLLWEVSGLSPFMIAIVIIQLIITRVFVKHIVYRRGGGEWRVGMRRRLDIPLAASESDDSSSG